jgi:hypothetical protein
MTEGPSAFRQKLPTLLNSAQAVAIPYGGSRRFSAQRPVHLKVPA